LKEPPFFSVVKGGERNESELTVWSNEEPADVAQQRQKRLEGEALGQEIDRRHRGGPGHRAGWKPCGQWGPRGRDRKSGCVRRRRAPAPGSAAGRATVTLVRRVMPFTVTRAFGTGRLLASRTVPEKTADNAAAWDWSSSSAGRGAVPLSPQARPSRTGSNRSADRLIIGVLRGWPGGCGDTARTSTSGSTFGPRTEWTITKNSWHFQEYHQERGRKCTD